MIEVLLDMLGVHALLGCLVSIWLLTSGLPRIDAGLRVSPRRVRALLLPGCVGLWPFLAMKVLRAPKRGTP